MSFASPVNIRSWTVCQTILIGFKYPPDLLIDSDRELIEHRPVKPKYMIGGDFPIRKDRNFCKKTTQDHSCLVGRSTVEIQGQDFGRGDVIGGSEKREGMRAAGPSKGVRLEKRFATKFAFRGRICKVQWNCWQAFQLLKTPNRTLRTPEHSGLQVVPLERGEETDGGLDIFQYVEDSEDAEVISEGPWETDRTASGIYSFLAVAGCVLGAGHSRRLSQTSFGSRSNHILPN
ncbi:hypothetical protein BV22DRAFT_1043998 [Leucogyrophana mollusca]|uniref:Uncharacterized protein n=1 Tax=Leucogyrophana mollusca TaxID=85980 RepID=A0ACB8BUL2_9AGAM|nr:hypothetical protein BV22DRAFT_1043998 [Leucogyrophana mollusca]